MYTATPNEARRQRERRTHRGMLARSAGVLLLSSVAVPLALPSPWSQVLAQEQAGNPAVYRLAPGDRLSVTVFDQPDISGTYLVEPSGAINLPLIGMLDVTRFTAPDLQANLVDRFSEGYLQNPVINVRLAELRPVTIVGQVRAPGRYNYVDGMSVETAMALAGGGAELVGEEAARRIEYLQAEGRMNALTIAFVSRSVEKARLEAALDGARDFDPPKIGNADPQLLDRIMAMQRAVLTSDAEAKQHQRSLLEQQAETIRTDIEAFGEQVKLEEEQIALLDEQIKDVSGLLANGLARKSAVIDIQRERSRSRSNLARILGDLSRSRSSLTEIELRLQELETSYRSRSMAELQAVELQLEETRTSLPLAGEDRQIRLDRLPFAAQTAAAGPPVTTITRYAENGVETFVADGTTSIRPGDIVQVGRGLAPGGEPLPDASLREPRLLLETPTSERGIETPERLSQAANPS